MSLFEGEWCYVPLERPGRDLSKPTYALADGVVRDPKTGEQLATYIAGDAQLVATFPPTENEYGQTVRKRLVLAPSARRPDRLTAEVEYRFDFGSVNDNDPAPAGEREDQLEPEGFSEFGSFVRPRS